MKTAEVLRELKAAGTAQNRKTYARHGVGENQFGVSYAVLGKLHKRIKTDHDVAVGLWRSGNHDARILALMIADPARAEAAQLDAWAAEADNPIQSGSLATFAARTKFAQKKMEKWLRSKKEAVAGAGWRLLAHLAMDSPDLPDSYFLERLRVIEDEMHSAANGVKASMNGALIAIGIRNPALTKAALAAAGRIGRVEVDHGETSCKTPDAAGYIKKTLEYREARSPKAKRAANRAAKC
jgi:3-methyladenine DNA glycosylase AlkD